MKIQKGWTDDSPPPPAPTQGCVPNRLQRAFSRKNEVSVSLKGWVVAGFPWNALCLPHPGNGAPARRLGNHWLIVPSLKPLLSRFSECPSPSRRLRFNGWGRHGVGAGTLLVLFIVLFWVQVPGSEMATNTYCLTESSLGFLCHTVLTAPLT